MASAGKSELEGLHVQVAKGYVELLKEELSAANLSSASKFLKDNLIVHVPESTDALEVVAESFKDKTFDEPEDTILEFPKRKEA